jgi:hypothetical protein
VQIFRGLSMTRDQNPGDDSQHAFSPFLHSIHCSGGIFYPNHPIATVGSLYTAVPLVDWVLNVMARLVLTLAPFIGRDATSNQCFTSRWMSTQWAGVGGGGSQECWHVFKLRPNADGSWTESVLYAFSGGDDEDQPIAGLIFDGLGNLYGTTIGGGPRWSKDGKELYYFDLTFSLFAVPVKVAGSALQLGTPQTLVSNWTIQDHP